MRSMIGCASLLAFAALSGAACGDTTAGDLFPADAGLSSLPVLGGRGGRGGAPLPGGNAGSGGSTSVPDAGSGDGGSGAEPPCSTDEDCADGSVCTIDSCVDTACVSEPVAAGVACGDALDGECSHPDTCDGAGVCAANDEADGAPCSGGACAAGACAPDEPPPACPAAVVSELPFEASWRTVGGVDLYQGTCDIPGTPDFAVVFTAPETGVYRFEAAGAAGTDDPEPDPESELADSVLTIVSGSCTGVGAAELECNDDANDQTFASRIDLVLEAGQSVTVYANEFQEVLPGGGSGTLGIRRLSND
jgi:hypothetical protein